MISFYAFCVCVCANKECTLIHRLSDWKIEAKNPLCHYWSWMRRIGMGMGMDWNMDCMYPESGMVCYGMVSL